MTSGGKAWEANGRHGNRCEALGYDNRSQSWDVLGGSNRTNNNSFTQGGVMRGAEKQQGATRGNGKRLEATGRDEKQPEVMGGNGSNQQQ